MQPRLNHWAAAPDLMQAFLALNTAIESCWFGKEPDASGETTCLTNQWLRLLR